MNRLAADLRIAVPLPETSDVVGLSQGRFLVVSDKRGEAAIVGLDRAPTFVALDGVAKKKSTLEAVAFDAATLRLRVFAEDKRTLYAYRWTGVDGAPPVLEAEHELSFGARKNKGVEGMAALDAAASPTGAAALLVANEGSPRALLLLAEPDLDPEGALSVELDSALLEACADFSGIAFDRTRNAVLVVSDESSALAQVTLARTGGGGLAASLVEAFTLTDERGDALERVEGVAVDDAGGWWVLLEDACELVRVRG